MKHVILVPVIILSLILSVSTLADEKQEYDNVIHDVSTTFALSTLVSSYCLLSKDDMEVALAKDLELQLNLVVMAFDRSRAVSDSSRLDIARQIELWTDRYIEEVLNDSEIQATLCRLKTFDIMHERLKVIGNIVFLKA